MRTLLLSLFWALSLGLSNPAWAQETDVISHQRSSFSDSDEVAGPLDLSVDSDFPVEIRETSEDKLKITVTNNSSNDLTLIRNTEALVDGTSIRIRLSFSRGPGIERMTADRARLRNEIPSASIRSGTIHSGQSVRWTQDGGGNTPIARISLSSLNGDVVARGLVANETSARSMLGSVSVSGCTSKAIRLDAGQSIFCDSNVGDLRAESFSGTVTVIRHQKGRVIAVSQGGDIVVYNPELYRSKDGSERAETPGTVYREKEAQRHISCRDILNTSPN